MFLEKKIQNQGALISVGSLIDSSARAALRDTYIVQPHNLYIKSPISFLCKIYKNADNPVQQKTSIGTVNPAISGGERELTMYIIHIELVKIMPLSFSLNSIFISL